MTGKLCSFCWGALRILLPHTLVLARLRLVLAFHLSQILSAFVFAETLSLE